MQQGPALCHRHHRPAHLDPPAPHNMDLLDLPAPILEKILHGQYLGSRAVCRTFRDTMDASRMSLFVNPPGQYDADCDDNGEVPPCPGPHDSTVACLLPKFPKLSGLRIRQCHLQSGLKPLACCTNLEELQVDSCRGIYDMSVLASCTRLCSLELYSVGELTDISGVPPSVTYLLLEDCDQLQSIPYLDCLPKLHSFTLHNCISLPDISFLAHCTGLTDLVLAGQGVPDVRPLASCHQLQSLSVSRCYVGDISPLTACQHLTLLSFHQCDDLWGPGRPVNPFEVCVHLTNLQKVAYHVENEYEDLPEDVSPLTKATQIEDLHLSLCLVVDLTPLPSCTKLVRLYLDRGNMEDCSVLSTFHCLKDLSLLHVSGLVDVPGLLLCRHLTQLVFAFCPSLMSVQLCGHPHLQRIDVSHCMALRSIDLSVCGKLEYVGLMFSELQKSELLKSLNVAGCTCLARLAVDHCANLVWARLQGCSSLRLLDLQQCLQLQLVDTRGCHQLSALRLPASVTVLEHDE